MILLAGETVVFLFVEMVLLGLLTVALFGAVPVLRGWNFAAVSALQYRLEKRTYLVVQIILFTLILKTLLLVLFCHLIDSLADLVPGAMCGAGVINSNAVGVPLLVLKIVALALAGLWFILNRADLRATDYPLLKTKLRLFLVIYLLMALEVGLDWLYLLRIPTLTPVQCCSIIYGVAGQADPLPLGLNTGSLLALFALFYGLILVLASARYALVGFVANACFLYLGYHAVVYFFGTYVYELPTHLCPFCMLQGEYLYYGYPLWGSLLLGVFFGAAAFPLRLLLGKGAKFAYTCNIIFVTAFVLLCCLPVGWYFLRNGVLL